MNLPATAAAAFVVVLFGIALWGMANGNFQAAGFSFLSAAIIIYIRETRLL